jgi:thiol:disulfide interchange protein DsbC
MNVNRMMTKTFAAATGLLLIIAGGLTSAIAQDNDDELKATIAQKLRLQVDAIADSPVPGLRQIYTDQGMFYVSDNGEYFMQARVFNIKDGIVDETDLALKELRLEGVKRFADSAIEFTADKEKYVINVFTDATCGYCRKLHNEIDQYNELGITVRYLAWPRAGINSQVYKDTVSIWCSEDQQQAITDAKAGKQVASASCENEVAEQFKFGRQVGVNGTPNIILPDGSVVPGYQPAQALAEALNAASS